MEVGGPFQVLAQQVWIKAEDRKPPATGEVITPTAVQAGSSSADSGAANLISQAGLQDRNGDGLYEQTADPRDMWRSAKNDGKTWVEFDFGKPQKLSTICIWNYNEAWYTNQGVRTMAISVWTPEAGWQKIRAEQALDPAEGADGYDEPTVIRLDPTPAQKVRFDSLASLGDPEYVGLSKVRFFSSLGPRAIRPYPLDGATGVHCDDLELTWGAGDGAKAHNIYLGTKPDDLKLLGKIEPSVMKVSRLQSDARYYWRIDETQADGSVAAGPVWSFSTSSALAGWWKLDEAEGAKAADSSGNKHDGVLHGNPVWQPAGGRVRGALQFDGVDDYVDTGWQPQLSTWTAAAWIKSPAAPTSPVASGPVHCEKNFQIDWDHGNDPFRGAAGVRVGGTWYSAGFGELKANTWYHLVATYDRTHLRTYKDGVLITDNAQLSGSPDPEPATLKFGKHAQDEAFFTGTVDEVCVFAYALNGEEVKALYSGKEPTAIAASSASSQPVLVSQR
jgi:hypothetical protein